MLFIQGDLETPIHTLHLAGNDRHRYFSTSSSWASPIVLQIYEPALALLNSAVCQLTQGQLKLELAAEHLVQVSIALFNTLKQYHIP